MKKFILSFILILCLFITGCSNSTRAVSTIDNFSSFAEDNSFSVKTDLEKYGKVN